MVDLDDTDGVPANEARESDAVGAGPLDPEGLDGAERPRPGNEIRVAGTIRRRAVGRESGADQIDRHRDMHVFVGVDSDDHLDSRFDERNAVRHVVGLFRRLTTPSGREGGQDCDGSLSQAPIRSLLTRPDNVWMSAT